MTPDAETEYNARRANDNAMLYLASELAVILKESVQVRGGLFVAASGTEYTLEEAIVILGDGR